MVMVLNLVLRPMHSGVSAILLAPKRLARSVDTQQGYIMPKYPVIEEMFKYKNTIDGPYTI